MSRSKSTRLDEQQRRHQGRARPRGPRKGLHRLWSVVAVLTGLIGTVPSPADATHDHSVVGEVPLSDPVTIASGPGNQNDPHISGSLVSYTNDQSTGSEIRYHDLATGQDGAIPNAGHRDGLSDVDGTRIVFRRIYTDGTTTARSIFLFDIASGSVPRELAPDPEALRGEPSIAGPTVAWVQFPTLSTSVSDVFVYDLDTGVLSRLSDDGKSNRRPAVSPDGANVVWSNCSSSGTVCDLYRASKAPDGTWSTAQLTDSPGDELLPDTNGAIVVYGSYGATVSGDADIVWKGLDDGDEHRMVLPGDQSNPNISANLVAYESEEEGSSRADLWVLDVSSGIRYRLTDTPTTDETLNDISVSADGTVRVVWAQADGMSSGSNDVFARSFRLPDNRPPGCTGVTPSTTSLWPPDHQFRPVALTGADDPDGDTVVLTVTAITQDEPVDGVDDGTTAPDALLGPASHELLLRAERSGTGDGRVYRIAFTASDPKGASCSGNVIVAVPVRANGIAIDSGTTFNSLVP